MKSSESLLLLVTLLVATLSFGCKEEVQPYMDKVTKALTRETEAERQERQEEAAKALIAKEDIPPPPMPIKMEPVINKEARVSVLGYHDFTEGESNNDMIINIDDFRSQMSAIKEAQLPVISMGQFLDWKQGKADIPAECVMITIDDGWKATHTLALPVLRDFGYPFTIFLYKNYVGIGGRSLTFDEVRELVANGATICSHSVSHQNMRDMGGRSQQEYDEWLRVELEESYAFLEENFGDTGAVVKTFAYPYGYFNDRVLELATKFGYEACFTVNGKKTEWDTEDLEIGRYVVHGTTLANFDPSLQFGGGGVTSAGRKLITGGRDENGEVQGPLVTLFPDKGATVADRLPRISVDLSKLESVVEDSISMRITGFGTVPHDWDPTSKIVSYQIPQALRLESCGVQVTFQYGGNSEPDMISWNFTVDHLASYLKGAPVEGELPKPEEPAGAITADNR